MNETYYHDVTNGMYYKVPKGVIYLTNAAGAFTGYQTASGQTVSVTGLTGLTQAQYNHIGMVEGAQAASTSMSQN